jgi:alpha-glucosidase
VIAFLLLVACGDDSIPPASHVLSDGTRVEVAADGSFELLATDGRALVSTSNPAARSFESVVTFTFGFFTFRRTGDMPIAATAFLGSEATADGVVLRWQGEGGSTFRATIDVLRANEATSIAWSVEDAPAARATSIAFDCEGASFAGFGAQYDDTDQKGDAFPLFVEEQGIGRTGTGFVSGNSHTTYFPMPYWLDWRGHGVLVDTPARVLVDLCRTDPALATVEVEDTRFDVIVFHGPTPKDVIRQLGDEVGRAPLPPDWAFSPWIGMQGGRDAVLDEVAALEAADVPFSAVWVQDWVGGERVSGDIYDLLYRWIPDETLYPNLAEMVATLRTDHGVRFLAYANSFVDQAGPHFADMRDQGLLIERAGEPYTFPIVSDIGSLADFTNPATYEYVQGFLRAMVRDLGFDGWMSDFGEWLPLDATIHEGDARLVHNDYPRLWHLASRQVMDELRPDGDWVIFSRSGWTRDHGVHQIVWLGDQEADFLPTDGLPTVVPALVNLSLSGVPFVTHDIAGYSGGPSTKELYLRWTELGAFTPIMRTHEGLMPATNWNWDRDAETTAHFRRFARVHEALAPELRELARESSETSLPIVRHLALEFPDDAASRAIHDEYMLGPNLLVAPVLHEGMTRRSVYLPPGTWFDVWTGTEHTGGATIEVDAPIGSPPVFARDTDRTDLLAL